MQAPPTRNDWKFQPPLQRAIGEHPLTAPPDVFAQQLATRQDPSVVSHTMGHHVNIDAPAGLVLAIATPGTRQDGPEMVSRPRVQRSAASSAVQFSDDDQDTAVTQPMPGLPFRELPTVSGPPQTQRLTRVDPVAEPVPIGPGRIVQSKPLEIQRSAPAASDDQLTEPGAAMTYDSEPSIAPRRTLGQSRRLGLGPPLAQVPVTSIQRASELALASPRREPAESQTAEAAMATNSLERFDPAERTADGDRVLSSPMPAEAGFAPAVQRAMDMPLAPPASAHQEAPQTTQETAAQTMDDTAARDTAESPSEMPVQRLEQPLGSAIAATQSDTLRTQPGAEAPGPGAPERAMIPGSAGPGDIAPRTGELPLLQRRAAGSVPGSGEPTTPAASSRHEASLGTPVKAESRAEASPLGGSTQVPLAGSRALGTFVQRAVTRGEVEATSGMTDVGSAAEQRVVSPLSAAARLYRSPDLGAANTSHAAADQAPVATLPGHRSMIIQRVASDSSGFTDEPHTIESSPLTLAPAAAQSSALSLPLAPVATLASVQRATASAQAAQAEALAPAIALQLAAAQPASPDGQETFFAQREVPSGSSAGGPSTQGSAATAEPAAQDEAMDALAGKLYDRIRSRLKSELLVDRERAGLLTDLR